MKQIYVIALFFLPFYNFSQLYIQPEEGKARYIYVEGDLLYVEQHIHLQPNPGATASVYLRDEGQLLQGDQNRPNTGKGMLSVFQEGKASAYTYNYWSLPVGSTSGNPRFEDVIFDPVSRIESNETTFSGQLNGKSHPLQISNRWIYSLEGTGYNHWQHLGNSFNVEPGEGFTMKGVDGTNTAVQLYGVYNNPGNEQRYDFRGIPNNGQLVLQVRKDLVKLIGNPYPSALDLNAFLQENTNITGIAYFWDSSEVSSHYLTDYVGGYGAYSPSAGNNGYVPPVFVKYGRDGIPIENTGVTGHLYSRRYSPIAQGFLVEGLHNGPIFFRNRYRVFQKEDLQTSQFKAPRQTAADVLSLRIDFDINNTYTRQLLLAFHPDATTDEDRAMDAKNLSLLDNDVSWNIEEQPYLINIRPMLKNDEIPLTFFIAEDSEIVIQAGELQSPHREIFFFDKHLKSYHNLQEELTLTLEEGEYWNRFYLTLDKEEELPVPVEELAETLIYQNNIQKRTEIFLIPHSPAEQLTLFDLSGKKIAHLKGDRESIYYEISTETLSKGIYIVKIISQDGTVISKKVLISN